MDLKHKKNKETLEADENIDSYRIINKMLLLKILFVKSSLILQEKTSCQKLSHQISP